MRGKCRRPAPPGGDGGATAVLGDADLEEILLRLPSAADLARAVALVCRRWRRVASGPAFLRRFRRRHPPQLLGFFVCKGGRLYRYDVLDRTPPLPVLDPTFLPVVVPPCPGVGGAVGRCRDFSLTALPSVDYWSLADSRDGLLLFCSSCDRFPNNCDLPDHRAIPKHFAVCNPLSGHSVLLPAPNADLYLGSYYLGAALVISDKDEGDILSFEVLVATYIVEEGPCLCTFSSSSQQWAVLPCPNIYTLYSCHDMPWIDDGARANGCVYWVVHDWGMDYEHILVLNLQTKKFSTINLPCSSMCEKCNFNIKVMRSEDEGDLRAVAMVLSSCTLHIWRRDRSRSAKGRWLKEDVVKFASADGVVDLLMGGKHNCNNAMALRIIDAGEGFVFIKHNETSQVFVLNLKEMTMQKLPNRERYSGHALPYWMALSPPLPNFNDEGNHRAIKKGTTDLD